MVRIGEERGLPTRALLTAMDRPLGCAIGNGIETAEAIACLRGGGPSDLRALVVAEVAEMLVLGSPGCDVESEARRVDAALDSGAALERFARLVDAQGGDPRIADEPERLHTAPHHVEVTAERGGLVWAVSPRPLGEGLIRLGGGRTRMDQRIDPGVGFEVLVRPGDAIEVGEPIGRVHARDDTGIRVGAHILRTSVTIGDPGHAVHLRPLISHRLGGATGRADGRAGRSDGPIT